MQPRDIEQILVRSKGEMERREYPAGFPALTPIPAARYGDPDFFELEMEYVFRREWLFAGCDSEFASPGDSMAIDHLPAPLLLIRGDDGESRAFFNACSHRGSRLVPEGPGKVGSRLTCPYHSWAYDRRGKLRNVPQSYDFKDLDQGCRGLRSVRCESWAGLVFINLDPDCESLRDRLAPVLADLDDQIGDQAPGTEGHVLRKTSIEIPVNWKFAADANLETYHVNTVHRETAAGAIDQQTTTIALLPSGASRMFLQTRPEISTTLPLPSFPHVCDLVDKGVWTYSLFPNVALTFSRQMMFTVTAWPVSATSTRYDLCFIGAEPANDETADLWKMFLDFNEQVIQEDVEAVTGMQASVDSGALESIPLCYQERRIYHLHEQIDRCIGRDRVPEALRVEPLLADHLE